VEEKRTKRRFTSEFKEEAVELAKKIGNGKAAGELGVSESCIRNWRKKFDPSISNQSYEIPKKSYDELAKENRRLQRENGYLKEINKILKKSTAIFSSDHMGSLK